MPRPLSVLGSQSAAAFTHCANRLSLGVSLLELNLVVVTIAVVALMVIPDRAPGKVAETDYSISEAAKALRFVRDTAARTDIDHGVRISSDRRSLSVFRIDNASGAETEAFDVYDPLKKSLYVVELPLEVRAGLSWNGRDASSPVTSVINDGRATCLEKAALIFDPSGTTRCLKPYGARIEDAEFILASRGYSQSLSIDSFNGKVSLK